MDNSTGTYLIFVVLGVALVIAVGQLLIRAGQVYLEEVFPDRRVASSVSKLLAVMFYLFALGLLGIISTMDVPVQGDAQTVVTKLGVVLLVLGIVYAVTTMVLARIRARQHLEEQEEAIMAASMPAAPTIQHEDVEHHEDVHHDDLEHREDLEHRDDSGHREDLGHRDDSGHVEGRAPEAPAPSGTAGTRLASPPPAV